MKIGVIYPQIELQGDPEAVRRIGLATEVLGFSHLLAYDHVLGATHDREPKLTGPYTERDPFHDPFVMFAHLAGITRRIEFTTGVLILPQRQTALVARQAADLDLFSGGRLRLGVGIGWNPVEYEALGEDFATRGKRCDEQIGLLRRLWSEPLVNFQGQFDRVDRAALLPRPRRPIPIWVGGMSPAAFRRSARLGDGHILIGNAETGLRGWEQIKARMAEIGRSPEGFGLELASRPKKLADLADAAARWRDAGGTHFAISTMELGLTTAEAHTDYLTEARQKLAGVMAA